MPPEPVTSPERRYVITRIDGGVETNVIASTPLPPNFTDDQVLRSQYLNNISRYMIDNPGVRFRVYSASNGGQHTDDDCIWDTSVQGSPI